VWYRPLKWMCEREIGQDSRLNGLQTPTAGGQGGARQMRGSRMSLLGVWVHQEVH